MTPTKASGATAPVRPVAEASGLLRQDEYFLARSNPVANADQREVENLAIELIRRPELEQGCDGGPLTLGEIADRRPLGDAGRDE